MATSRTGFVQQLAVSYLAHGYWFYVSGSVPDDKDPEAVDAKLVQKYGIGVSRQSRARRKSVGIANVHYLRFERRFLLLATHGHHPFYDHEAASIRDARRIPIKFSGYSISVQRGGYLRKVDDELPAIRDERWRVRVQIARDTYQEMKADFLDSCIHKPASCLAAELFNIPFEPYAPVRQQLLNILRMVNVARRAHGLDSIGSEALRYKRRIVSPFEPAQIMEVA